MTYWAKALSTFDDPVLKVKVSGGPMQESDTRHIFTGYENIFKKKHILVVNQGHLTWKVFSDKR